MNQAPGTPTTDTPTPLRVAVVGCGAFGRNHLRVYRALEEAAEGNSGTPVQLVAVVDPVPAARDVAAQQYSVPGFATVDELLGAGLSIHAASVCTPTVHHADAAVALLGAGIDVLIEKPIAASLDDADRILAAARPADGTGPRIVQVGHLERFNPAVTAAVPLLHRPMFFESHRLSIFTPRSLDVDVVLDLMIHDLDVVLSLADSPVREVRAVGLPVLSREVDIANVRVEFETGAVANFTASRVSTERVRKLRFFQPHQYLSLDFARQDLLMIDVTAAASLQPEQMAALFAAGANLGAAAPVGATDPNSAATPHPSAGLSLRKVPTEPGEPLRLELLAFLQAVRTRETPVVSGEAARRALALALDIQRTIQDHRERSGL